MLKSLQSLLGKSISRDNKIPPTTSFQLLSDLHLEVNQQYSSFTVPTPASPHLILAGDIGRLVDYDKYLEFLHRYLQLGYKTIFLILGNHEFYSTSFDQGISLAQKLGHEPSLSGRLILLHRRRYDIPDSNLTVLGCTLWSHIPDSARDIVRSRVQDFAHIKGWTVDAHNAAYAMDVSWLREQVKSVAAEQREIVVVTHHAPLLEGTSAPEHKKSPLQSAFATDVLLEGKGKRWQGVKMWCFGHTHFTTEFKKVGVRVVSNQRGYVLPWTKEKTKEEFDAEKVIWV